MGGCLNLFLNPSPYLISVSLEDLSYPPFLKLYAIPPLNYKV